MLTQWLRSVLEAFIEGFILKIHVSRGSAAQIGQEPSSKVGKPVGKGSTKSRASAEGWGFSSVTLAPAPTMPLFETTPIDVDTVTAAAKAHWNVTLGKVIKASQNHTFLGTVDSDASQPAIQVIVRVTPNAAGKRTSAIELELRVLQYLAENKLSVCPAYPVLGGTDLQVQVGDLSISVFHYAQGEPVVFQEWKWMTEQDRVVGLGKFIGQLHFLLDQFTSKYPELASQARLWSELHDGVLKDAPIHADDKKTASAASSTTSPRPFGLIHGDINPSNYFYIPETHFPAMFDWDQLQCAWRLYDLSSCIWTVVTLESAGSPIDLKPVPVANVKQYTEWLLSGYESVTGHPVDRSALDRMISLRRELYRTFCSRALSELEPGTFMYNFCEFMNNWLSKDAK